MMKPEDVSHLGSLGGASVSLLGIASSHTNGHVREAAVRELGKTETGAELPFLLLRVNDWVPQIRSVARNFLQNRIRPEYVHRLLVWLPMVLRLRYAGRDDHSTIIETVRALFVTAEAREALYEGLKSRNQFVRRFCFQLALNSSVGGDLIFVLQRALENSDPQVRRDALQKLPVALPNAESKGLLVRARNDRYAPVRREALHIFAQKYPKEADREFELGLLDGNIAVREEAQQYFRQKGTLDLLEYYSRKLDVSSNRQLCAAIAGLGETGHTKDSQLVEPFFRSETPKVRATALHAAAKLNPGPYFDIFLSGLCDTSGNVAREAVLALSEMPNSTGGQHLWEIYQKCPHLHGKRWALFLIARINKWDSINFLIQSLIIPSDPSADLSQSYIARWFARYNRSFAAPTTEQLSRLRNTLSQCSLLLDAKTQRQMDSLLKGFGT